MLGKRSPQRGLFEADHLYLDFVGRDTFYGFLASQRGRLFRDEDFGVLYCPDNGRNSVPPSMLSTALMLQAHDGVSDEEAKARADFDLRWKVGLGTEIEDRPFAKSTLQLFRAQLIIHDRARAVFERSLAFARESGYLKKRKIKTVLDTSYILGRGAAKDTYNLLADGIVQMIRALASLSGEEPDTWAASKDLSRYFGSSMKGEAGINWDEPKEREEFLEGIVADADRLLEMARQTLAGYAPGSAEEQQLVEAARLLSQLLLQDVERRPDGVGVKEGVAPDRIVSVHDPEMRHGHKSKNRRFDGHKVAIAVEPESQLITAVAVLAGNAPDSDQAMDLVEQTEKNTGAEVEETIGDCAYGDGVTRRTFAEAQRKLIARVPSRNGGHYFAKQDFSIDLETETCRCPGGQQTRTVRTRGSYTDRTGRSEPRRAFYFDPTICAACRLRPRCVRAGPGKGRTISLHPQEALLQEARRFQESEAYALYCRLRQVGEHRLARLVQLGIRKARYFGRAKTLFQVLMAATVANLTLVATKTGQMRSPNRSQSLFSLFAYDVLAAVQKLIRSLTLFKRVQTGVFG
jgi:transposase